MRTAHLPLLAVLAGAACTPVEWVRPGADATDLDLDWAQCRRDARLEAFQESLAHFPFGPVLAHDRNGRLILLRRHDVFADPGFQEFSLTQRCLREKGWTLQTIPPRPPVQR